MKPISVFRIINLFIFAFLMAPLVIVIATSFSNTSYLTFPPKGFSFKWYEYVISDGRYLEPLLNSLLVAVIATIISLIIGTMVSIAVVRYRFKLKGMVNSLFLAPLIVPSLLLGIGLLMFFSKLGITDAYIRLIAAHCVLTIPYVVRSVVASLGKINPSIEEASRILGASPLKTVFLVTLPLIKPALIAGGFFAFIISFDELVVGLFLTSSSVTTLPLLIYSDIQFNLNPSISAISSLLIIGTIIIGVVGMKFIDKKNLY
ncbi:ABC transporter permease [Sporosarcina obsidiansis]|uniref:ABC transporter permease n=1 Tax=Sporosarcina obsidiansis TaxID=2660748 RepID=UPI00129AE76F|nr:ABC transporter permease [Sporosarcina obsidiansis]